MQIDDQLFEVKMKTMHKETLHGSFDVSSRASTTHIKPQHNRERICVDICEYYDVNICEYMSRVILSFENTCKYLRVIEVGQMSISSAPFLGRHQ